MGQRSLLGIWTGDFDFFNVAIIEPLKLCWISGYYLIKNLSEAQGRNNVL